MFCFGYSLGDGKLQDSFRETLTFKISGRSPFLVITDQPDTERALHGWMTKIFDVVPYKSIIKT